MTDFQLSGEFRASFGWFLGLAALLLLLFGYWFDRYVADFQKKTDGYTAIFVVIGVGITLLVALPFIGAKDTLILFGLFFASGFFMVRGSMLRHARDVEEARKINDHADR